LTGRSHYGSIRRMNTRKPTTARRSPPRAPGTVLLTVEAGARWLGLSRDALRSRLRLGQLPFVRLGRRLYLVPDDVRAAIRKQSRPVSHNHTSV